MNREEVYNKIDYLRKKTSQKDWDDDNCEPLKDSLWDRVIETVEVLQNNTNIGYPRSISPASDMTVHLNWDGTQGGDIFVIEVVEK